MSWLHAARSNQNPIWDTDSGVNDQVACQWSLSPDQESSISTVVFVGTLLGANAWGAMADAYGRRAGFFVTAIFAFVFGLSSSFAPNYQVCFPEKQPSDSGL